MLKNFYSIGKFSTDLVVIGLVLATAAFGTSASAQLTPSGSPHTLVAEEDIKVEDDAQVFGDVHANGKFELTSGATVFGDVTAGAEIKDEGTIVGSVTEGAADVTLPDFDEGDLRAMADRILNGDRTFSDEVVDDIVFVDGKATIKAGVSGEGMILAESDIIVEGGIGDQIGPTLVAVKDVKIEKNRGWFGDVVSGKSVKLEDESLLKGRAFAHEKIDVKKKVRVVGDVGEPPADVGKPFVLADRDSEIYRLFVAVAGDEIKVEKNSQVSGDLHSNDKVQIKKDSLIEGDVSAADEIDNKGTITGTVTENASPVPLPGLFTEAEMRSLADRVFEDDQVFSHEVIDDVVFVGGKVEIEGSLGGRGTILATEDIRFDKEGPPVGATSQLSLISLKDIKLEKNRQFRGVLRAGGDISLDKEATIEGILIADRKITVDKDSTITFLMLDLEAPVITLVTPADGSLLASSTPEVLIQWQDAASGVNPASAQLLLDDVDVSAAATVDGAGLSFTPEPLAQGPHSLEVTVSDQAGNTARLASSFTVDSSGPALAITSPSETILINQPTPIVTIEYSDATSGIDLASLAVGLDAYDLTFTCSITADRALCSPPNLGEGLRTLEAQVRDLAGNLSTTSFTFESILDQEPPLLAIEAPNRALIIGPLPAVEISYGDLASGIDATTFKLLVDGVDQTASCSVGTEQATCAVPALAEGAHTLQAHISDRAGQTRTAERSFELDLDAVPPQVEFVSLGSGPVLLAEPSFEFELAWSDDDVGVDRDSLQLTIDGEPRSEVCEVSGDGASCSFELEPVPAAVTLGAFIMDRAGNPAVAAVTLDLTFDFEAPTVRITSPGPELFLDQVPAITVDLADAGPGIDPASLEVLLDFDPVAGCSLGPDAVSCPMPALSVGAHVLVAKVRDQAGNPAQDEVSFAFALRDRVAPSLEVVSPAVGTVVVGVPELRLAYSDAASGVDLQSLFVALDGDEITSACLAEADQATCTLGLLAAGVHTIEAELRDLDGNLATAAGQFELELQLPVTIEEPFSGQLTTKTSVTVRGIVASGTDTVRVNEQEAVLDGETFIAENVALREGANVLSVVAGSALGGVGSATVTVVRDTLSPQVVIFSPRDGSVVTSQQILVTGEVNDPASSSSGVDVPTVTVGGFEAAVEQRAFVVQDYLLQPGENLIRAEAFDTAGNVGSSVVRVTYEPGASRRIEEVFGNGQTAAAGHELSEPLIVRLVNAVGQPLAGRRVKFKVTRGNGEVRSFPDAGRELLVVTDENGIAEARFALGDRSGRGNHEVTVTSVGLSGEVVFCASAEPAAPQRIKRIVGNNQTGAQVAIADSEAPYPLLTQVFDELGNPVAGLDVTYRVLAGGGHFDGASSFVATTDSDGKAAAIFTLGPEPGINNNLAEADVPGMVESSATFTFSGVAPVDGPTSVSGLVLDNQDRPVPDVTVRIEDLSTTTDAEGRFVLSGVPVGLVHLVVQGATTSRPGTWPKLEFEFVTISGIENTVGMPIRLLPIDVANAQVVGGPVDVTLPLTGVPGAEITVFSNSVTFPDGSKVGDLSFTQVLADKVPMVAPLGSDFMLAWTIQPPGVVFDPPLKIAIPNLGGEPGTVVDMFSFDHDLGEFITAGTAAVSEDGFQLVSTPGSGISKAGWGGCVLPPPPGSDTCHPSACKICPPGAKTPVPKCDACHQCNDGTCEPKKVEEVTAKANGEDGDGGKEIVVAKDQEVSFSATVKADCGTEFEWSFGDGETSQSASPTHAYEEAGEFTVEVRVGCQDCSETSGQSDQLTIRVIAVDLEVDGLPEESEPPPNEEDPGAFLTVNDDDDDDNGTEDLEDSGSVSGEDDLIEVTLNVDEQLSQGELRLDAAAGGSSIKVWTEESKGTEIELPKTWNLEQQAEVPDSVWVEGVESSSSRADIELVLTYDSETITEPLEDKVLLTVIDVEFTVAPIEEFSISADDPSVTLVAAVFYRDFDDPEKVIAVEDGSEVTWESVEGGGSLSASTTTTEEGLVSVDLSTSSNPGSTYRAAATVKKIKLKDAGANDPDIELELTRETTTMEVVPGVPATISISQDKSSYAADGTDMVTFTADVRDQAGNPVEDDTALTWFLSESVADFEAEGAGTTDGRASLVLRAPDLAADQTVTARIGELEATASISVRRVTGSLSGGPSELDILAGGTANLRLSADAADGTGVFWTTSNGSIVGQETLNGGEATATLSASGGTTGDVVVTATIGDRLFTWQGLLLAGTEVQLIPQRRFLVGNGTEDSVATVTWLDGTVRQVPIFATTEVEVRGPALATARVDVGGGPQTIEAFTFENPVKSGVPGLFKGLDLRLDGGAIDASQAHMGRSSLRFRAADRGTVPASPELDQELGIGASLWLRPAQLGAAHLIGKGEAWSLEMLPGGAVKATVNTAGGRVEVSSAPVVQDAWNFIRLETIRGQLTLNVNNSISQTAAAGPFLTNDQDVVFGGGLEGFVDDVVIYHPGAGTAFNFAGVDGAGLIELDDQGRGTFRVTGSGLPTQGDGAIPYFFSVELVDGTPQSLSSADLRQVAEKRTSGGIGCYVIYRIQQEFWAQVKDVVLSFLGGDPQTNAGVAANIAGGIFIVGDVGALVKNLWRAAGYSDVPPNGVEALLSGLGLVTEFAVGGGEFLDVPISAARAVVVEIGDSPLAQIIGQRFKRVFTKFELPSEAETAFLKLLESDLGLAQNLNRLIKNEDLYEAAVTICKRTEGFSLRTDDPDAAEKAGAAHRLLLDRVGIADEAAGEWMIKALQRFDEVTRDGSTALALKNLAELDDIARLDQAVAGLQKLAGKLDSTELAKAINNPSLLTPNYDEARLLIQLGEVADAERLLTLVKRMKAPAPRFALGWRYELEVGVSLQQQLGKRATFFDHPAGGTDIDVLLEDIAVQAKSTWPSLVGFNRTTQEIDVQVGVASATHWIQTALDLPEVGGDISKVIYIMPNSVKNSIPQEIQDVFDLFGLPASNVMALDAIKRARLAQMLGAGPPPGGIPFLVIPMKDRE